MEPNGVIKAGTDVIAPAFGSQRNVRVSAHYRITWQIVTEISKGAPM
jgi:hypothetical protein